MPAPHSISIYQIITQDASRGTIKLMSPGRLRLIQDIFYRRSVCHHLCGALHYG